jgi:hypothetical protein
MTTPTLSHFVWKLPPEGALVGLVRPGAGWAL